MTATRPLHATVCAAAVLVLLTAAIVWIQQEPAVAEATPQGTTNRSFISADAFDGQGTVKPPVTKESIDAAFFSDSVAFSESPSTGERSAGAAADQTASIDTSESGVLRADIVGGAMAEWADQIPGDAAGPRAEGRSEFTMTFEVTGEPIAYSITGTLAAVTEDTNAACSSVTVTDPNALHASVSAPSNCEGLGNSPDVSLNGLLDPGTHSLSIVAVAAASNPDTSGGGANVQFDISVAVGCTNDFTAGPDTITGTAEADVLCGGGGDDTISGGDEADLIIGGEGSDDIQGGASDDTIFGDDIANSVATGDDSLAGGTGDDFISGGPGEDLLAGDANNDLLSGDEGPDHLLGGRGHDQVFGGGGVDDAVGGAGDDLIDGGRQNDVLEGRAGSDKLRGRGGRDRLVGGSRKDVLIGGEGGDRLLANDGGRDDVRGGPGRDRAKVDEVDEVTGVEVFL